MTAIEWINHASYALRLPSVSLVCDPWLEGTAFKDGWRHTTPTVFDYDRFSDVTHIWISHQHPDHFAPASLRKIPLNDRERIIVLYQETDDKLVVNWLRSNGFADVREVPLRRWLKIAPDAEIAVGTLSDDSWLAVRSQGRTILNVNDCVLKSRERIEAIAEVVGPVDVLLTQFSYAQWIGNPGDTELRRKDAREKLDRIRLQDEILRPRTIVPFASYIYFCHEENFFMNDGVNNVFDVASFVENDLGKTPVVLYPGETWDVEGAAPDWHAAARRYGEDFERCVAAGPTNFTNRTNVDTAISQIGGFLRRLGSKNPLAHALLRGRRATVYATDAGQAYEITSRHISIACRSERECDLVTSLENVLYAFRTPWGGNTLHVSGRFTSYTDGGHLRFFALMRDLHHYNVTPINLHWLQEQVMRIPRAMGRRLVAQRS